MCGIVGFIDNSNSDYDWDSIIDGMTNAIKHRGPDAGDRWIDREAGIALGHRRLSIIDLSPTGSQPMTSSSGRFVTVFNGEIYNFQDIRAELESKGHSFRGTSDTEVLLAATEQWGFSAMLQRTVGMFAIAIWDRELQKLYLGRDRIGEKPLYYGLSRGAFLFSSELKSLRHHPYWTGSMDQRAIGAFFKYNYIPGPWTIFENFFKLKPGTYLEITTGSELKIPEPIPYWSPQQAAELGVSHPLGGSEEELLEQLDALLQQSVRGQMIADVPLGAFLSGGVDSSIIVAVMQKLSPRPVKTFTIGFGEDSYNEAKYAKAVAERLETDHTELYITPNEAIDVIPRLPTLYDEPFSDSSQIPTYLVAKLAQQHVTVSLSGDAGDELFGGYNRYFWGRSIWRTIGWVPSSLRRLAANGLTSIPPNSYDSMWRALGRALPLPLRSTPAGDKIHKAAGILDVASPDDLYDQLISHWQTPPLLSRQNTGSPAMSYELAPLLSLPTFVHRMMYQDMTTYLPDDILVKVDRAAMGVSLETRVPFLDHRLVEFALRLPLDMKVRGNVGKWLLRRLAHNYVGRDLIERPKMGFGVPIDRWLRGELRDWAGDLLNEERLLSDGYLDPKPILEKWTEHQQGTRNWQYHLWDVLMFQSWLNEQRRTTAITEG